MNFRLCRHCRRLTFLLLLCWPYMALAQSTLPVTIANNVLPATTLTDYSVRLDLNATNAPGFDFANNGDDIAVWNSDRTASLDFYVENVDPIGQTAIVWVRVPSVPTSPPDTEILFDYNLPIVTPLSNLTDTFTINGFKYHSQPYTGATPGPETRAAGEAEFNFDEVTSNTNYGCTNLTEINTDHSSAFTQNGDFGLSISTHFVVPADALYEFRFGSDFGHGGELYLDDVALESDWTSDVWWGLSFANPDVLVGSRFLSAGSHTLRALGYERCCDGRAELQYRYDSDGDGSLTDETFTRLTTTSPGLTLLAPSCPVATATIGPVTTVPVTLANFSSRKIGPTIKFKWKTADETFNAGFNLWGLIEENNGEEPSLVQLNRRLLRSRSFDSMAPQAYRKSTRVRRNWSAIKKVAISSVDINGKEDFFGPFDLNHEYGDEPQPIPINWGAVYAEYQSKMQSRGYTWNGHRWVKQRRPSSGGLDSKPAIMVGVDKTAVYKVSYQDLLAQGVDWQGVHIRDIAVTHNGEPIPRAIRTSRSRFFGPGSEVHFVGTAPDDGLSIYQSERFYTLKLDRQQARAIRPLRRSSSSSQTWHFESKTQKHDNQHVTFSPMESPWVMDFLFRTGNPITKDYQFELPKLATGVDGSLELRVGGVLNAPRQDFDGDGMLDKHHNFTILINGETVDVFGFSGQAGMVKTVRVPIRALKEGENVVSVRLEDSGYPFDAVVIDSVTLFYPVTSSANTSLNFSAKGEEFDGLAFTRKKRRGLLAYAYQENHNMMRLRIARGSKRNQYTVPFIASGSAHYFVGAASELSSPSSWRLLEPKKEIDLTPVEMLIISHPNFIGETLADYAQARQLQGTSAQIINTDDIAREFGPDIPLHIAIKRFLKHAASEIEYKHVLLVGGHTYDYLGRQHDQNINFIPSFYASVGNSRFTPSDQPFVDFDEDGFPEKSIGRWPIRLLSELTNITSKSLLWSSKSSSRQVSGHSFLLLSDTQREFDFAADVEAYFAAHENLKISSANRVFYDKVVAETNGSVDVNQQVRERIINEMSSGATWVVYNGHASPSAWSFSQMMSAADISKLKNHNQPVVITSLGCYTTYYEGITHNSLALQLLFSGTNGAAAIMGPAVIGSYEQQMRLANNIADEMIPDSTLGEAVLRGMNKLPVNARMVVQNWALLADPSLPSQ